MLCIYPDFNILRRPLLSLCSVACPGILAFLPINETDTGQTLDISLLIWNFASKTLGNFSKVKELHPHLIWFIWPIWNYLILLNLEIDKNLYEVFFWHKWKFILQFFSAILHNFFRTFYFIILVYICGCINWFCMKYIKQ